jgi:hypothetical protein
MRINVHIERVVLLGLKLRPAERERLQDAIQSELAGLLGTREAARALAGGDRGRRQPHQTIELPADGDPGQLGRRIALAASAGMGATGLRPVGAPAVPAGEGRA